MEIRIVKCTALDKEWLFTLHSKTLKEYIAAVYGWNEDFQRHYFNDKLSSYYIILNISIKVGAINYIEDENISINIIETLPE